MRRSVLALVGIGVFLVIAYFAYDILKPLVNPCESIFQQTRLSLATKLDVVRTKGEVIIGQEKLQDLTERSQMTALNLKTCCIVLSGGQLNSEQFLQCKDDATHYTDQIEKLVTYVSAARAAQDQGDTTTVKENVTKIDETLATAQVMSTQLQQKIQSSNSSSTSGAPPRTQARLSETEPNNSILEANELPVGGTVSATVGDESDADYFVVHSPTTIRDTATVTLDNRSTTLSPQVWVYNANKSQIGNWRDGTNGANVSGTFVVEPQQDYYVRAGSYIGSQGAYELSLKVSRAYDSNEPNDTLADATPAKVGTLISANILDKGDVDWYKLTGFTGKHLVVRIENQSDWRPRVYLRDHDKHVIGSTYATDPGANVELTADATPGDYSIQVEAFTDDGGPYTLLIGSSE